MSERLDFLQEKAENFRAFLLGHSPDAELAARIEGFRPDQLWTTLTTLFLPAVATLGIEGVANEMLSHLTPAARSRPRGCGRPAPRRQRRTWWTTCACMACRQKGAAK